MKYKGGHEDTYSFFLSGHKESSQDHVSSQPFPFLKWKFPFQAKPTAHLRHNEG